MERVKIDDNWDQLTKDSVTASNMGISYGKLMAQRYEQGKRQDDLAEYRRKMREMAASLQDHCKQCGEKLPPRLRGRADFCSPGCREKWAEEHGKEKPEKRCVICGQLLKKARTRYCSDECMLEYRRKECLERYWEKYRKARVCQECGGEIRDRGRVKYCSGACEDAARERRAAEYKRQQREKREAEGKANCQICGRLIIQAKRSRYCSAECLNMARREQQREFHAARRKEKKEAN